MKNLRGYQTMSQKLTDYPPVIHLGSGKRLPKAMERQKSKKKGISILKDKYSGKRGVSPIGQNQYGIIQRRDRKKYFSPARSEEFQIVRKKQNAFFKSRIRLTQVNFPKEKMPIMNVQSHNLNLKCIDQGTVTRVTSQKIFSIKKTENLYLVNYKSSQGVSSFLTHSKNETMMKRKVKVNNPETLRPTNLSQKNIRVNFRTQQPVVHNVKFNFVTQGSSGSRFQENEDYTNKSKECFFFTKKSKDTCADELRNSHSRAPLDFSTKSEYQNYDSQRSLSLNIQLNSKNLRDSQKAESVISQTPSEAMKQQRNDLQFNRLKQICGEMSGIQKLSGEPEIEGISVLKNVESFIQEENLLQITQ